MSMSANMTRRRGLHLGQTPREISDNDLITVALYTIWLTGIPPHSTVLGAHAAGARELVVVDPTQFTPGGIVQFHDGTAEADVAIDTSWDGTGALPLVFNGMDHNALVYGHADGAAVGTNLFKHAPNNIDNMLTGKNCVLYVTSPDNRVYREALRQDEPQYSLQIDYRRRMMEPDLELNSNLWQIEQQTIAHQHMTEIRNAFLDNPQMVSPDGTFALDSGDPVNSAKERFTTSFHQLVVGGVGPSAVLDYGATGELSLRGLRRTFFPRS